MINSISTKYAMGIALLLFVADISFGQECFEHDNSRDPLVEKVTIDKELHADFFDSHETSYPWYIIPGEDGTFEIALDRDITEDDKIPREHTSNCVSTHQGDHRMDFCNAVMRKDGSLKLCIYGGMPAYSSSLMITIKDSGFSCFFKASYPAPGSSCRWKILSKKLKLKDIDFIKGGRLFGWVSIGFEETATHQGKTTTNTYKIEGYIKPIIE